MKRRVIAKLAFLLLISFSVLSAADEYVSEIQKWQKERLSNLNKDDGWPTLVGLYWLTEGSNTVGSRKDAQVVLPSPAPANAGVLKLEKGTVHFQPESGAEILTSGKPVKEPLVLNSDKDPKVDPTVLSSGSITFFIIQRGDRIGVRVRDKNSPMRKNISKLEYFAINPAWRLIARFEPYDPPKKIPIVNVLNMVEPVDSAGALVFQVHGQTYRVDVLEEAGDKGERLFWVIFADSTSGKATYGAGRYLYTSALDEKGNVVLDFNKAYNPPCAFTNFATCPLPPKQNKLPVAIEAGEKFSSSLYLSSAH